MRLPEAYVKGNNVRTDRDDTPHPDLDLRPREAGKVTIQHNTTETWLTPQQIKYLRVPDEIIDIAKESQQAQGGFRGGGVALPGGGLGGVGGVGVLGGGGGWGA